MGDWGTGGGSAMGMMQALVSGTAAQSLTSSSSGRDTVVALNSKASKTATTPSGQTFYLAPTTTTVPSISAAEQKAMAKALLADAATTTAKYVSPYPAWYLAQMHQGQSGAATAGTASAGMQSFVQPLIANNPPSLPTNLYTENFWFSQGITNNASFENGTNNWVFYPGSASSTNATDCTTAFSGSCSNETVVATTSYAWLPQVMQILRADPNVNYTLKFKAKALATTTLEVSLQQNHDQYLMLGLDKRPTVTPTWQSYAYSFSSTATTSDSYVRAIFSLGSTNHDTYWIDDVQLVPDNQSTMPNPSFENITDPTGNGYGEHFWVNLGPAQATQTTDCTTSTDGDCSTNINVTTANSTDWYVQYYQGPQSVVAGQTYLLTFDAKSSSQRVADVLLQQNHDPLNPLTPYINFTTYPGWNHYVIELTPNASETNARVDFNLATSTGHIWFDNMHFTKKQNTKLTTPHFTGIYNDPDITDTASAYEIQVIPRNGSWTSPVWNSGQVSLSPQTPQGTRTATSTYAGPALSTGMQYYWRLKLWDAAGAASSYTNGNDFFMTPGNRVQDLSYTYDAVGNITHLVDASYTKTAKVVDYTYDDLSRLIAASSTPAIDGGTPQAGHHTTTTYTYNPLGSLTSISDTDGHSTTYSYSSSGYANPDAPTAIGTTTAWYDNNGNMTGTGLFGYGWDYRNRLHTWNYNNGDDTNYAYDEFDSRIRVETPDGDVVHYPNTYFSIDRVSMTPTKHLFFNGTSVTTFTGATGSATPTYTFTNNLGSTQVTADQNSRVQEVTDYNPYGSITLDDHLAGSNEGRKFINQYYDGDTNLSYLNARFYDLSRGQFLSEDPVFWEVGQTQDGKAALLNSQAMNSYAYAGDNPIVDKDPNGRCYLICAFAAALFIPDVAGDPAFNADGTISSTPEQTRMETALFFAGFAIPEGNAKNTSSVVKYSPEVIAQVEKVLGSEYAKMLEQGGERAVLMGQATNERVLNLVNDLYRTGDKVPGGTPGAAIYQSISQQLVEGRDHFGKIANSLNRISNMVSSLGNNLSAGDKQALTYMQGQLGKAQTMIKSIIKNTK